MPFPTGPTKLIEAGDTMDLEDYQKSRSMAAQNIVKGFACIVIAGNVTIATAGIAPGQTPFVPGETKDNSGGSPGDLEISGVGPDQYVALTLAGNASTLNVDDIVEVGGTGTAVVTNWDGVTNENRYAVYVGREAGIFSRDGSDPFQENLSTGIVPDEPLEAGEVGWFRLMEASA